MAKYQSQVRLTYEKLAAVLNLPEGVRIDSVDSDSRRDIVAIYLSSGEEVEGYTFPTQDGIEKHNIGLDI